MSEERSFVEALREGVYLADKDPSGLMFNMVIAVGPDDYIFRDWPDAGDAGKTLEFVDYGSIEDDWNAYEQAVAL